MLSKKMIGGLVVIAAGMGLASSATARDLSVVSWGGPVQKAFTATSFGPFTQTTKIPIGQTSWDGGIGILRAKVQGGVSDWDLVHVESEELAIGCEENLYEKLDFSKIGGKEIYYPEAVHPCGVGTLLYSYVMAWDPEKLKNPPKNWADFYDLKKYPGKRALRAGPKFTLETALLADGVAPKDLYKVLGTEAGVARAFKKLDTIKSNVIWWQGSQKAFDVLVSGEVTISSLFNGRIAAARKAGKNLSLNWNQSIFGWDSWVIIKGSPNKDDAYKLLAFMGDAQRQADQMKHIANGTSNKKAISLITDKVLLGDLPSTPANQKNAFEVNTKFWLDNFDKLSGRFTKWTSM